MGHATISAPSPPGEWRCAKCSALLGRQRGPELHIRHKTLEIFAAGAVRAVCRRCGTINETAPASAAAEGVAS